VRRRSRWAAAGRDPSPAPGARPRPVRAIVADGAGVRRLLLEMGHRHLEHGLLPEGGLSRQAFEHDAAERIDIAGGGGLGPLDQLGSEVVERAHHLARLREDRVGTALGQTEVGERRVARLVQHDVGRLDVPVHEVGRVEGVEPRRDLGRQPDDVGESEPPLLPDAGLERSPRDVGHGQVAPIARVTGVEHRHEMLVADLAGRPGLVDEPPAVGLVVRQLSPEDLEGHHLAVVTHGAEHDAHPALAEDRLEAVWPQTTARRQILGVRMLPVPHPGQRSELGSRRAEADIHGGSQPRSASSTRVPGTTT
jgi:hypothetical protein